MVMIRVFTFGTSSCLSVIVLCKIYKLYVGGDAHKNLIPNQESVKKCDNPIRNKGKKFDNPIKHG